MSKKAIYALGGIAVITGSMTTTMKYLLENKIKSCEVCQKSFDMMNNYEPCIQSLGSPIEIFRPSALNKFTYISHTEMKLAVPVKGSISKGLLYISAFREEINEPWDWNFIKLARQGEEDMFIFSKEV